MEKNLNLMALFNKSSFVLCDTLSVFFWKGLIIVTVILVIAAIEGMCIFLLHWFANRVQS